MIYRLIAALILSILILPPQQSAPAYFVAPYGNASNAGALDSPRTLAWAMSSAPAGATVWLIPGTYKGEWDVTAPGITIRSLPSTRARLDGSLAIHGAGVTIRDLELRTPRGGTPASQRQHRSRGA